MFCIINLTKSPIKIVLIIYVKRIFQNRGCCNDAIDNMNNGSGGRKRIPKVISLRLCFFI